VVLHHFVVKDREVQGKAELDGVARRESDLGSSVGGKSFQLRLVEVRHFAIPPLMILRIIDSHFYYDITVLTNKKLLLEKVLLIEGSGNM